MPFDSAQGAALRLYSGSRPTTPLRERPDSFPRQRERKLPVGLTIGRCADKDAAGGARQVVGSAYRSREKTA